MTSTAGLDTVADVLAVVGDIPPHRILLRPAPGTATEADARRLLDRDGRRVELIDGVLVEKAMGYRESLYAISLLKFLIPFVDAGNLGVLAAPDALMRLRAGRLRLPDVSFAAWATLPSDDAHLLPFADYAPDLAVEVISPENTRRELAVKRADYFAAGTRLVWQIDPDARTVEVFTGPATSTVLTAADILTGGDVLLGFALPLATYFGDRQLNPRPAGKRP